MYCAFDKKSSLPITPAETSQTDFLKQMHQVWLKVGLQEDTANLDFTTIPCWGDDSHLENNWLGKLGKSFGSMLAVLAHDPDSGLIEYGSANVLQKTESETIMEILVFYRDGTKKKDDTLRYVVFDSKFSNYENLRKLDENRVRVITIRRRGKLILERIAKLPEKGWVGKHQGGMRRK